VFEALLEADTSCGPRPRAQSITARDCAMEAIWLMPSGRSWSYFCRMWRGPQSDAASRVHRRQRPAGQPYDAVAPGL